MKVVEILYLAIIVIFSVFLLLKTPFLRKLDIPRSWFLVALVLKLLAGAAMFYVYTHYYPDRQKADIYKYFDDGKIMYEALKKNPAHYWQMIFGINNDNTAFDSLYYTKMNNWYRVYETVTYNDSHTMIRLHALLFLVSGGYFTVHQLFFILLSFVGFLLIFLALAKLLPEKQKELFAVLFFIPSVVFWTSGALKESVLMFALGLNLFSLVNFFYSGKSWNIFVLPIKARTLQLLHVLLFAFSMFMLLIIKTYVIATLIPVLIGFLWVEMTQKRRAFIKYALSMVMYILVLWIVGRILPSYDFSALIVQKQHDFIGLALHEQSKSYFTPLPIEPMFFSLIKYAPLALFNGMFRPLFWQTRGLLDGLAAIEILMINVILFVIILFFKKKVIPAHAWFFLLFAIVLYALVGYTTPVAGAIVRYRVPALMFLCIFTVILLDRQKVQSFFSKIKLPWKK